MATAQGTLPVGLDRSDGLVEGLDAAGAEVSVVVEAEGVGSVGNPTANHRID